MDSLPPSDSGSEPPPPSDSGEEPPTIKKRPAAKVNTIKVKTIKKRPAASTESRRYRRYPGDSMKEYLLSPANWNFGLYSPDVNVNPQDILADEVRHFFMEVYSPPRIAPKLPQGNATTSIDIQTGWNLSQECGDPEINWKAALAYQKKVRPMYLMTCPPCTAFSTLMYSNWFRRHQSVREAAAREGMWHLNLTMDMIKNQLANNDFYVFEHLDRAVSWETQVVQDTCCERNGGQKVVFDQCMLGLKGPDGKLLKKRTVLATNIPDVILAFSGLLCTKDHDHGILQGQLNGRVVSKWSQVYPPELCKLLASAICKHHSRSV